MVLWIFVIDDLNLMISCVRDKVFKSFKWGMVCFVMGVILDLEVVNFMWIWLFL